MNSENHQNHYVALNEKETNYKEIDQRLIINEKSSESTKNNHLIQSESKNKDNIERCQTDEEQEEDLLRKSIWRRLFGPIKGGSLRGSILAMASITFGGGCLAFSSAIRDMGLVNGLILFFYVALISFYTLSILTQAGIQTGIYGYNELIEKYIGKKMVVFSDINNLFLCLGVIIGYQKYIYEFAEDVINHFVDKADLPSNYQLYIMLACFIFIQIPLTMLRKISVLQYASITGSCALIYSIIIICIKMPSNFAESKDKYDLILFNQLSWKYLVSISVFLFGFSSHNGIFQIYVELKKPSAERYSKVLNRSFLLEVVLYLFISLGGFLSFLSHTKDNVLRNYDSKDTAVLISKLTLFICLHCSMAINYNIMRQSYKSFFLKDQQSEFSYLKDLVFAFFTLLLSNAIVLKLKSVTQILGIVGGVCTVVICFLNPILIHIKVNNLPKFSFNYIISMLILGSVIILGTASTIYSIYDYIMQIINNENTKFEH